MASSPLTQPGEEATSHQRALLLTIVFVVVVMGAAAGRGTTSAEEIRRGLVYGEMERIEGL
jgi:hypothetical protein